MKKYNKQQYELDERLIEYRCKQYGVDPQGWVFALGLLEDPLKVIQRLDKKYGKEEN